MRFSHLLLSPLFAASTMALLLLPQTVRAFGTATTTKTIIAAFSSSHHAKKTLPKFLGRSTFRAIRNKEVTIPLMSSSSSEEVTTEEIDWEQYHNKNNLNDQVFSAISGDGGIKVTAATVRNLVNEFMIMHSLTEVPIDALGRTATCSVLLSNGMQDEQVFQVSMNGDGPLRGIVAIANGKGEVRGYVGNPGIGSMSLQEAVGKGTVNVVKNHPDWPNPYNGITAIRDGDIDRDIGIYLAESEQRSCALAAATTVNGILCTSAGGYLVEQLPDCSEETMKRVETNLATLVEKDGTDKLPTGLLNTGVTPLEIAEIILDGLDMKPLQQIEPKAACHCTEERLFRAVRLLPKEEVDDILKKEEQIEARCQFCGKVYRMGPDEVAERFANAQGDPSKDSDMNL
uniref:33 kDa chaperonin n=1 Tax=Ditylum brightwellii TaxID=49249 RepID=A0A6V2EEP6_9STRA|mmetsp:Transcript_8581/g.12629  ORF Transcript_8581/g.12629 Transcript_8581/m.12629 type:complete len:400 (+) Transcript_8581:70-1269(+)